MQICRVTVALTFRTIAAKTWHVEWKNPRIMQDFRRKQGIERDAAKKNIFLPVEKNEKNHWTKCAEKNGVGVIRDNRV